MPRDISIVGLSPRKPSVALGLPSTACPVEARRAAQDAASQLIPLPRARAAGKVAGREAAERDERDAFTFRGRRAR